MKCVLAHVGRLFLLANRRTLAEIGGPLEWDGVALSPDGAGLPLVLLYLSSRISRSLRLIVVFPYFFVAGIPRAPLCIT